MPGYQVQRGAAVEWRQASPPIVAQTLAPRRRWAVRARIQLLVQGRAQIMSTAYAPGTEAALGGWTPSTGATLAPCIWEAVASDTEWIEGDVGSNTPLFPWTLGGTPTPLPAGNWDVPVRALKVNTTGQIRSVLVDSGGSPVAGGTGIWHALTGGYATYTDNLTISASASHVRYETQA